MVRTILKTGYLPTISSVKLVHDGLVEYPLESILRRDSDLTKTILKHQPFIQLFDSMVQGGMDINL
jgi:hypothetical protein